MKEFYFFSRFCCFATLFILLLPQNVFAQCGFGAQVAVSATSSFDAVPSQLIDIDGDGLLDIVSVRYIEGQAVVWYRNLGGGSFAGLSVLFDPEGGGDVVSMVAGDITGNGKMDLVMQTQEDMAIALNNSTVNSPSFNLQYFGIFNYDAIDLADVNRDGRLDLVFTDLYANGNTEARLMYIPNTYAGFGNVFDPFDAVVIYSIESTLSFFEIHSGDITGNGHTDFIIRQNQSSTIRKLVFNPLTGLYNVSNITQPPDFMTWWPGMHLADLNNNGRKELIAGYLGEFENHWVVIISFNTSGTQTGQINFEPNIFPAHIQAIDVNRDGLIDIGISGNNQFRYFQNPGGPAWTSTQTFANNAGHFRFGDITNNDRIDLITENTSNNNNQIFRALNNNLCLQNNPPSKPGNVQFVIDSAENTLTVSWDAASDLDQPDGALTYDVGIAGIFFSEVTYIEYLTRIPSMYNGRRHIVKSGRYSNVTSFTFENISDFLSGGADLQELIVSVQAVDNQYRGSEIAYSSNCSPELLGVYPAISEITGIPASIVYGCDENIENIFDFEGFSGPLNINNWTFANVPGFGNGSLISEAPDNVTIIGSNAGEGGDEIFTNFCITVTDTIWIEYDWLYSTADDGPNYDPFIVFINGESFTQSDDNGPNSQSGSNSVFLLPGDELCFSIWSVDNCCGAASVQLFLRAKYGVHVQNEGECLLPYYTYYIDEEYGEDPCGEFEFIRTFVFSTNPDVEGPDGVGYFEQELSVVNTAVFLNTPEDASVQCVSQLPALQNTVNADVCGEILVAPFLNQTFESFGCTNKRIYTRTWRLITSCDTFFTYQIITVDDTTPPDFTSLPPDTSVECDGNGNVSEYNAWLAQAEAGADNCGGTVTLSHQILEEFSGECPTVLVREVQFTVVDNCGNASTAIRYFNFTNNTPSELIAPPDIIIGHTENSGPENTGFAEFNEILCVSTGDLEIWYFDNFTPGPCGFGTGVINRIWEATDHCGASKSAEQEITIVMQEPESTELMNQSDFYGCSGDEFVLSTMTPNAAHEWSTGETTNTITVSASGNYHVTVTTADGCLLTDVAFVIIDEPDEFPQITGPNSICSGGTGQLTVNPPFSSYLWNTGATTQSVTIQQGGLYTVTVSYFNSQEDFCFIETSFFVEELEAPPVIQADYFLCDGDSVVVGNNVYKTEGSFVDTLIASDGCDSVIINTTIAFFPNYFVQISGSICDNEFYNFNGNLLNEAGVYTDTLESENGCDSVVQLTLIVYPTYNTPIQASICDNESYNFFGINLTASGEYSEVLVTQNGCDSVITLTLTVYPTYLIQISETICEPQTYFFSGETLSSSGVYYDTLSTVQGCDSVIELTLTVLPAFETNIQAEICDNETYDFHGAQLTASGVYTDTLTTSTGCDSVVTLTLTVHPTYLLEISATICEPDEYEFGGELLTTSGVYYDSLQTVNGCDSVIELTLTVNPGYEMQLQVSICENESFQFAGQSLNQSGIYYDSLLTSEGCDSVIVLNLTVHPTYQFNIQASICDNETYNFNGTILTQTGVYTDSLETVNGCDSVITLFLLVRPTYLVNISEEICEGESFQFAGQTLTQAGVYTDSLTSQFGCDSVIVLNLTVNPVFTSTLNEEICGGGSFDFHGTLLTQSGQYVDTLESTDGCDSVVILNLTVLPSFTMEINAAICDNESYDFHGLVLTEAGQYVDTLTTAEGCDSVIILNLIVHPTYLTQIEVSICGGGTYDFHGQELTESGIYFDTLSSQFGCDSVIELELEFLPAPVTAIEASICDGEVYIFHGSQLTESGVYSDTLSTAEGCDSVIVLTLIVHPEYTIQLNIEICGGQSYNFNGQNLTEAGEYSALLQSQFGCDSLVFLNLSVVPVLSSSIEVNICDGEGFEFGGQLLTQAGIYTDTLISQFGCDSIVTLNLIVHPVYDIELDITICANESYELDNQQLSQAGTYTATMQSSLGCDSTVIVNLTVLPTFSTAITATICDNETYPFFGQQLTESGLYTHVLAASNGCDSLIELTLIVHPTFLTEISAAICDNEIFDFHGTILNEAGIYSVTLQTVNGCDSVIELTLEVLPTYFTQINESICDDETFEFFGQQLNQSGTYTQVLTSQLGCDSVFELNLQVNPTYLTEFFETICFGSSIVFNGNTYNASGTYTDVFTSQSGCDSVEVLNLTVLPLNETNITATICDNESYSFEGQVLTQAGSYSVTLTDAAGCDSIVNLQLIVLPTYETIFDGRNLSGSDL
jgi:hypothetical protein